MASGNLGVLGGRGLPPPLSSNEVCDRARTLAAQPDLLYYCCAEQAVSSATCRSFFALLVQTLDPLVGKRDTNYRGAIDTHRRVAVFLEYLAQGGTYYLVGKGYGLGKTTVKESIESVSNREARQAALVWLVV